MITYNYVYKHDYDKKIKLGNSEFLCYSKKKLDELYPKSAPHIVGEAKKIDADKNKNSNKKQSGNHIGVLEIKEFKLDTFTQGTHGKFLHKELGYVCVGGDNYVALNASRVPFLILLFSMLVAIAVCMVLILLMLSKGPSGQHGTEHPMPDTDPNVRPIESTTEDMGEDIDPDTTTGYGDVDPVGPEDTEPSDIEPSDTQPQEPDESDTETAKPETTGEGTTDKAPEESVSTGDPITPGYPDYPDEPAVTTKPIITPDETLPPDTTEAPETDDNNGGGSVSMIYTLSAKVSLKNEKIGIMFQNPTKSTHNVMIELYVVSGGNEYLIGKSQLIPPGYQLSTLEYSDDNVTLVSGIYGGLYKVLFYDGKTGEKANVNSHIPDVKITVND